MSDQVLANPLLQRYHPGGTNYVLQNEDCSLQKLLPEFPNKYSTCDNWLIPTLPLTSSARHLTAE